LVFYLFSVINKLIVDVLSLARMHLLFFEDSFEWLLRLLTESAQGWHQSVDVRIVTLFPPQLDSEIVELSAVSMLS